MSELYCDHGLYGAYAATPTWGSAQDGDGKAQGAATPAIASILLNIQPDASAPADAVVICGVTFTAGSNWTVGASIDASANNLATAINASTTAVASTVTPSAPQLRDLVYARGPAGGAPSGTVQIMTRAGSADFNYATNSAVAISHANWATAPTITQFSGGASGAWGVLLNTATIWPAGRTVGAYGAWCGLCLAGPTAYGSNTLNAMLSFDDAINVRTRASGVDKSLTFTTLSSDSAVGGALVSTGFNLVFDDGTVWSGDGGQFTIGFANNDSGRMGFYNSMRRVIARSKYGLRILSTSSGSSGNNIFYGPHFYFLSNSGITGQHLNKNILFEVSRTAAQAPSLQFASHGNNQNNLPIQYVYHGCRYKNGYTYVCPFANINDGYSQANNLFDLFDTEFEFVGIGAPPSGFLSVAGMQAGDWLFRQCRWIGWAGGFPLVGSQQSNDNLLSIVAEGCTGLSDSWIGVSARSAVSLVPTRAYGLFYSADAGRPMRYENVAGMADWFPSAGYPTLGAQQQDGTFWSMRLLWRFLAASVSPARPFIAPRSSKVYTEASAAKNISLELLVDPAAVPTRGDVAMMVAYTDSTGARRVETTYQRGATALAAGSSGWSKNSYPTFIPKRLELTTAYAIKQYTEIDVYLSINERNLTGGTVFFFVDPDFGIA